MFSILHDIEIQASPKLIFEMVTTPAGFNRWWTLKCSGILALSETYNFHFSEEFSWWAEVKEFSPNKNVSYLFTEADADWVDTLISFELIPKADGTTLLRFEHLFWETLNDHYRRTSFCWAKYLIKMKAHLENK